MSLDLDLGLGLAGNRRQTLDRKMQGSILGPEHLTKEELGPLRMREKMKRVKVKRARANYCQLP